MAATDDESTTDINEKYYADYCFTLRDTNGETISVTKSGRYLVSFEYYVNDYNDDIQLWFIKNGVNRMTNTAAQEAHKSSNPIIIKNDNKETSTGRWINATAVMAAQADIENLSIGIARAKGADLYLANMTITKLRDSANAAGYYALIPDTTEYILEKPYYVYAGGESGVTALTYADIIGTETIYGQDDDSHGELNWSVDMNTSPAGDAAVACTWTDHTLSDTYTVDAEAGTHYKTCTVENCPIAKTGEAAHEGGEATCKEQATCSVCGAKYGELGEHGEAVEDDTAKDPTCTEAGKEADKVCSLCGELIEAGAAIDALGHNYTSEVTKPATCDADGVKTYTCGTCGHSYTEAISAKGHGEAVKDDASYVAPTCTEAGKEANMVCPDCNAILTEGAEIAALGHTEGEAVRENVVDATLNAPGSYDEVVYCTVCNTELSRVTKEIPQLTGAVAEVNGTKYATLAEAIEAAGNGDTVYLLANIEVTSMVSIDKNITLALGEYNITRTTEAAEGRATAILVSNGATVIITGTGTVTAKGGPAVWAYSGNVTIESGNYVGTNHAVYASGTSTVVINGGKFSISVVGTYNYVINILDADRATCTITVNGGEFVNFNPFNNGAEGTGTNFVADGYHYADEDNDGIYTIHEENYTAVVTAPTCVDEGYTTYTCDCGHSYVDNKVAALGHTEGEAVRENVVDATLNAPGSYDEVVYCTVCNTELSRVTKEIPQLTGAAAMVNGINYGTLAEAIDAANAGDTVYLLKDIELDSSVSIKKNITLDLGEYDITRTTVSDEGRAPAILVGNGATVIITGNGTVTANGGPAVWANGGNVTIESGNYVGTNHAVYAVGTSTVVINGGKFSVSVEDKYHYVINILDADRATSTITVNGGEFVDFNPFKNGAEGTGTNFVAPGLHGADEDNDGIYTIHTENYTAVVTAPTCEDEGYTTYTCDCGHSYVDNKVAALGHTEGEAVRENVVDATLNAPGSY
ncbi:MAG: hypothetical protein II986_09480, partial [Alistipes sp.]|nr:hypothetical protein [Alistipes sp.]